MDPEETMGPLIWRYTLIYDIKEPSSSKIIRVQGTPSEDYMLMGRKQSNRIYKKSFSDHNCLTYNLYSGATSRVDFPNPNSLIGIVNTRVVEKFDLTKIFSAQASAITGVNAGWETQTETTEEYMIRMQPVFTALDSVLVPDLIPQILDYLQ